MKRSIFLFLLTACLLPGLPRPAHTQGLVYQRVVGGQGLDFPTGLAYDSGGNLYVAEYSTNRVQKFAPDGTLLLSIGAGYHGSGGFPTDYGTGKGQFESPTNVAVDAAGNIYVSQQYRARIQKFDSNGEYLTGYGPDSENVAPLTFPHGVAIDGAGNLYVADGPSRRVLKLDPAGHVLLKIGIKDITLFNTFAISSVAIDSSGNIYIPASGNHRVEKFSPTGQFLLGFGAGYNGVPGNIGDVGRADGQLQGPVSVVVDNAGTLYVLDAGDKPVQIFDAAGHFQSRIGLVNVAGNTLSQVGGIAVDNRGHIALSDEYNQRIQTFQTDGTLVGQISLYNGKGPGQLSSPTASAADDSGNLYVMDTGNNRILKYDPNGNLLLQFGDQTGTEGALRSLAGIAVDHTGIVYVVDRLNQRVAKYDAGGNFIGGLGSGYNGIAGNKYGVGSGPGQFTSPGGIGIDSANNVYVGDYGNNRIEKFSPAGTFLKVMGGSGTANGKISDVSAVTADGAGNVFAADLRLNRIQKFDTNGHYLLQIALPMLPDTYPPLVIALAADSAGNLYAGGSISPGMTKFDALGRVLYVWRSSGNPGSPLVNVSGIAVDSANRVFLTDSSRSRVAVYGQGNALHGTANLEGYGGASQPLFGVESLTVQFRVPGTANVVASQSVPLFVQDAGTVQQDFWVAPPPSGTYDIAYKTPLSLQVVQRNVLVGAGTTLLPVTLPAGDANNDNRVDIADFGVLVNAYNGVRGDVPTNLHFLRRFQL